jgi:hypothetical protein
LCRFLFGSAVDDPHTRKTFERARNFAATIADCESVEECAAIYDEDERWVFPVFYRPKECYLTPLPCKLIQVDKQTNAPSDLVRTMRHRIASKGAGNCSRTRVSHDANLYP